jgi:hypothetical protein
VSFFLNPRGTSQPSLADLLFRDPQPREATLSLDSFIVKIADRLRAIFFTPLHRDDEFHGRSPGELFGFTDPTNLPDWATLEAEVRPFYLHPREGGESDQVPDFEIPKVDPISSDDTTGRPRVSAKQALAQLVWLRLMAVHRWQRLEALFVRGILEAVWTNTSTVLQDYLDAGWSPDFTFSPDFVPDPLDKSPSLVCAAAYRSACDVLRCLYTNKANFNATDHAGRGILFYATLSGTVDRFACLASLGVSMSGYGPALIYAGRSELLLDLLSKGLIARDDSNADRCTVLHAAADTGDFAIVSHLVRQIHPPCSEGDDPDFLHPISGSPDFLNAQNTRGRTPLILAVQNQRQQVVELLMRCRDLDPSIRDAGGQDALYFARETNNEALIGALSRSVRTSPSPTGEEGNPAPDEVDVTRGTV